MEKILITGGNGFFATRLTKHYENKYEILAVDKDVVDITDEDKVIKVMKEFKPNYVIHTAAIAVTEFCNEHPEIAYDINVKGATNIAKACENVNAKMIFMSTEQVFNGNTEGGPYTENDVPVPDTEYGKNKLEAEGLLREILDELWVLRFTWMFGVPEKGLSINANILWDTTKSIIKGEKIKAPVNEYRGMTYVNEVIENFDKIFKIPYGTYHIGSMNDLNRYEVAELILKEMGIEHRQNELLEKDEKKYKDNKRDIRLNTEKIAKAGLAFVTTEEGIKNCIKDYKLSVK